MRPLTMGSLFDGIGGFPLASERYDIKPLWASEIEPFPMEVTKQRFPSMMHGGDITKLKGSELFPVDIVCGGSPCQDLSVAGARAGLAGARSGLFMEQIRIVKEMRQAEKERGRTGLDVRPRYMVWENVQALAFFLRIDLIVTEVSPPCFWILAAVLRERRRKLHKIMALILSLIDSCGPGSFAG